MKGGRKTVNALDARLFRGRQCADDSACIASIGPPMSGKAAQDYIEACMREEQLDMARAVARDTLDTNLVTQVDAMCVRFIIRPATNEMRKFVETTLPTTENLVDAIDNHDDVSAEMLMRLGARFPSGKASRGILLSLLERSDMPRTISLVCDNAFFGIDVDWDHFVACINTPNIRAVRMLSRSASVSARLNALEPAAREKVDAIHFYWSVRYFAQLDADWEQIKLLQREFNLSLLTDNEIVILLRRGDCFRELNAQVCVDHWKSAANPFRVARPLGGIVEWYSGQDRLCFSSFRNGATEILRARAESPESLDVSLRLLALPVQARVDFERVNAVPCAA